MLYDTPLRKHHTAWAEQDVHAATDGRPATVDRPGAATGQRPVAEVEYVAYGPGDDGGSACCELPATFGTVEIEYAAIRRAAAIMDAPHRGTIRVSGPVRRDFLNRLLTQELKAFGTGDVAESFWLNRKGRIDADLLLVETGDAILLDVDVFGAAATVASLDSYLFAEDVQLADATDEMYRLTVHGPVAGAAVDAAADGERLGEGATNLAPMRAVRGMIAGADVVAARRDTVGAPGLELFLPRAQAGAVWDAILTAGSTLRVRPAGWFAYNTARIEGGTPLFNVDFAGTNLPHETGVLPRRVSFTKGCYLGQEIVARTENLGRPRQVLAGLRIEGDALPVAGGQVFAGDADTLSQPIGVITSSTLSPMLGARPIAFAMVKSAHGEPGTTVRVNAEGEQGRAEVGDLRFWDASERSAEATERRSDEATEG